MPKIRSFEKYYLKYEEWFEKNQFIYESELQAVRNLLPKNGKGVEIGVGSARFAKPLGIKLGIEPSGEMRKIAEKRNIKVIDGVAEKLPLDSSQFDFALMVTTVCFLDNIELAFKEVYRILNNGGSFIIGFVDSESSLGSFYRQIKEKNVFYRDATFYSVSQIIYYLEKVSFCNLSFNQTIFHNLVDIKSIEPVKEGYGKGSFVVIRAEKQIK